MNEKVNTRRDSKSHNDRYFHETADAEERGVPYKRDRKHHWKQEAERSYFSTQVNYKDDEDA